MHYTYITVQGISLTKYKIPTNLLESFQIGSDFVDVWCTNVAEELNGPDEDVDWIFEKEGVYEAVQEAQETREEEMKGDPNG